MKLRVHQMNRSLWMQELQNHTKLESDMFGRSTFYTKESSSSQLEDFDPTKHDFPKYTSHGTSAFEHSTYSPTTEFETEKHPVVSYESQIIDKSVIQEEPVIKIWDKESRRSKVSRRMRIILFPVVLVALFLIYGFKKINRDREGSLEFNSERVGINRNDGRFRVTIIRLQNNCKCHRNSNSSILVFFGTEECQVSLG